MNKYFSLKSAAALSLLFLLNAGCAGYRVGSMLPTDVETIYVPTVLNKSGEPLIEVELTQAIAQEIQKDGSLTIVPEDQADTVLTVVLLDYNLEPVSFQKTDRSAANQYRINLTASLVLRRTSDQSVVAEAPRVKGQAVFDVVGDLSSSKRNGNPLAAEDLGKRIVQRIVEYW